jgi:MFS-type transporter involved in bile tolerance (Atg22 family)
VRGNPLGRRRPFFLIGVPLTAAALVFLSTYPPLWAVIALMTVFSFFLAVAYDPYLALLPDLTTEEERGRVGGVMAAFNMLGQISVILMAFLLWETNERLVFWLVAAGLVGTFAVTFVAVREPPAPAEAPPALRGYDPVGYLRDVLRYRELAKYVAATGFFWLGTGGVVPFLTRVGVEALGVAEHVAFMLVLPAVLGTAIFAIPAGLLAERVGKKRVLAAGLILYSAAACCGALLVQGVPDALVVMSIVGVANAVATALMFPLLADLMPRARAGEFTGLGSLVWSLTQPVGAVAAGAMADLTGTLRGAFAAGGLCIAVAFVVLLTVRPERAQE